MGMQCELCGGRMRFEEDGLTVKCECCGVSRTVIEYFSKEYKEEQAESDKPASVNSNKNKRTKLYVVAVAVCIIVAVVIIAFCGEKTYSADNINMSVVSKTNISYNEDLARGQAYSGYFYEFQISVKNDSSRSVERIVGDLEILNKEGKTLSVSTLNLTCNLEADLSQLYAINLNVEKGENARELWNSELQELTIKFRTKEIRFADKVYKEYPDAKNKTIYPVAG